MSPDNHRSELEVADIFRKYGSDFRTKYNLSFQQLKVMSAIENCRTSFLGYHKYKCDHCGYVRPEYNSCRNRHCPKCQWLKKEKWILQRKEELFNTTYYHIVFTIPAQLNSIALVNQREVYNVLFRAASETLLTLCRDAKHLGAEIGILSILHTWGQSLIDHPHLHCIVPGGGLSEDGIEWLEPKKSKKNKKFFIHVNVLSDLFKKKFLSYLKRSYRDGELIFEGKTSYLENVHEFKCLIDRLYKINFVTYCKKAFGSPEQVIKYLGRYTHRVAISNTRLIKIENGQVYFYWKNYRKGNKKEIMHLDVFEFIRRFLLHVLPSGFMRIRYYGLFSNRNRKEKIGICQKILGKLDPLNDYTEIEGSWSELLFELTNIDALQCPKCKKGRMILVAKIGYHYRSPPITVAKRW